jgi:hypothetical protein
MTVALLTLAQFKALTTMPEGDVDVLTRLTWQRPVADSLAATPLAETAVGFIRQSANLTTIRILPGDVLVASDTDYATISVWDRSAGGPPVLVGSTTTQASSGTGSWAKGIAIAIPVTTAAVLEDDQITVSIAKTGNGVLVPKFCLVLTPDVTFIDARLIAQTSYIYSRLRARYEVPFDPTQPYIETPHRWLEALVQRDCYRKRGGNPGAALDGDILANALAAEADLKEAADAKDGLFQLPLLNNENGQGVSKGNVRVYSEASPYVSTDIEACIGRLEDRQGYGSSA